MSLLNLNYFEIFGIEAQITIDIEHLNKKYLTLQSEFHPDKFVNASNLEKSMATRISTYINDAYNTLSDLVERVDYILQINNYSKEEHTTFKNTNFLTDQMMLSEKLKMLILVNIRVYKMKYRLKLKQLSDSGGHVMSLSLKQY